jgi:FXSXX-COOH protein
MRPIDEDSAVSSMVLDLGGIPLATMPALTTVTHSVLDRVMPGSQTPPVPVAAFQSAI